MNEEEPSGESFEISDEAFWKLMLKKHFWKLVPFIAVIIAAFISGVYVFVTLIELPTEYPEGPYALWYFNDWSIGRVIWFVIIFLVRELLFVGLPTLGVFAIIGAIIWFTLPDADRAEIKARGKRREAKKKKKEEKEWWDKKGKPVAQGGGGGGFVFLVWVAFLIIVAVNGNWDVQFGNLNLFYFVETFIWAIIWVGIIFGIPAAILLIWWIRKKLNQ